MTVRDLIQELSVYEEDREVRIVNRNAGWDDSIYMVESEIDGLDIETQVGICIN